MIQLAIKPSEYVETRDSIYRQVSVAVIKKPAF